MYYNHRKELYRKVNIFLPHIVALLLFGPIAIGRFQEAIEAIYRNQHPPDCSKAKFLVSGGFGSGFGSQVTPNFGRQRG
jgi:hypothetical protein